MARSLAIDIALVLLREATLGTVIGIVGGVAIVALAQSRGTAAGAACALRGDGRDRDLRTVPVDPRVGISRGLSCRLDRRQPCDARRITAIVAFLDAATWLAQIAMFVLFGLLAWPERLPGQLLPALGVALTLMLVARPAGVFLCSAPFRFSVREKLFISWVGLRGAVGFFLASIPLLVGLPNAQIYFDVGFVVVLVSLLVQGWTIAPAARWLRVAKQRPDVFQPRVELDLPGQRDPGTGRLSGDAGQPVSAAAASCRPGRSSHWSCATKRC